MNKFVRCFLCMLVICSVLCSQVVFVSATEVISPTLTSIKIDGVEISDFDSGVTEYDYMLTDTQISNTNAPQVTYTLADASLSAVVTTPTEFPGSAAITVTNQNSETKVYTINYKTGDMVTNLSTNAEGKVPLYVANAIAVDGPVASDRLDSWFIKSFCDDIAGDDAVLSKVAASWPTTVTDVNFTIRRDAKITVVQNNTNMLSTYEALGFEPDEDTTSVKLYIENKDGSSSRTYKFKAEKIYSAGAVTLPYTKPNMPSVFTLEYAPWGGFPEPEPEVFSNADIVKEIAMACDRQGGQIMYDQLNGRRSIFASPEEATAQRKYFLDCSSYVNSCYREGFGVNILPYEMDANIANSAPSTANYTKYARENPNAIDVVGYWVPTDYPTDADKQEVVDYIYGILEVGDILTYRHGVETDTKGHVYIYIGNNNFMHCAGAGSYQRNASKPYLSYDSKASEEANGTIATIKAKEIFETTTSSRYIFKVIEGEDSVKNFSILRPFARNLTPTEEAVNRMKIAGLSMEKVSSVYENSSVNAGDLLTYTVTLENTNNGPVTGVEITDVIPQGTQYVSGDSAVSVNGNKLTWTGDVPGKTTVNVSYTVKITENTTGATIESNDTYVSGVKLGRILHSVSAMTPSQQALIAEWATGYAKEGKAFANTYAMIKELYTKVAGTALLDYNSVGDALDDAIDTVNFTKRNDTELSKAIAPNLYGGYDLIDGWKYQPSENDKTRLPKKEHLLPGDVILADWTEGSGGERAYVFAGGKTLITVEDGVCKTLTIGDDIYTKGENILITLLAYGRYAVIRPGMENTGFNTDIASLEITTPPNKTIYTTGERFDTTGMVVSAVLTDGTKLVLNSYAVTGDALEYPQNTVTISVGGKTVDVPITVKDLCLSIDEASKLVEGAKAKFEGIVAGVACEGQSNDTEMIIKDLTTDTLMAVRNIPYGTYPNYAYKVGDIIKFEAEIKKDTSTNTTYDLKYYLDFVDNNNSIADTIVSQNNKVTYKLDNVVTIDAWEDMQNLFNESLAPYTYIKFSPGAYISSYEGSFDTYHRIHNNHTAESSTDIKPDGTRAVSFLDDVMTANLGTDWFDLLDITQSSELSEAKVKKEIYAVYIGGNKSYYQLVILDNSWIYSPGFYIRNIGTDNVSADVCIPEAGSYKVIFADYEGYNLNNYDVVDITVSEKDTGVVNVKTTKPISLGKGDKIMLWTNSDELIPKCKPLIIE